MELRFVLVNLWFGEIQTLLSPQSEGFFIHSMNSAKIYVLLLIEVKLQRFTGILLNQNLFVLVFSRSVLTQSTSLQAFDQPVKTDSGGLFSTRLLHLQEPQIH